MSADDDRVFRDIIGSTHSASEQERLSEDADCLTEKEFADFPEDVRSLLVDFQSAGYSTDSSAWEAIQAHPDARRIAAFAMTLKPFRRPILDPSVEYEICDNLDCQASFPAGAQITAEGEHWVCSTGCAEKGRWT